ncbi:hypothetical protein [Cylindrospermum sp. FACHB-282]|uniref:hypothetical protein n=1 Tax=Cylindrospermum sp. FACHB-282 TaxID=2692794 RepID=UPI0016843648|nr:hypothetical protein [Cylindrospermum sp. FACHB-282]MBD2386875.1 hypothetical protein [Cylindrospermum sp. FACHB-282]
MTTAQSDIAASLEINLHDSQNANLAPLWRLVQLSKTYLQRFLWHSHAYGTIFAVLLLSLVSLIFLSINWFYRRLFVTPPTVETKEWDISHSN